MNHQEKLQQIAGELPLGTDPRSVRRRIEALEQLLEGLFEIPLIRKRIGLDALVGLLPVAGDAVTGLMGLYLVWEARNLGLPRWKLVRMAANVGIDTLVGAVPVLGDLFDLAFSSNTRNLRIIRRHLDRHHPASATISA